MKNEAGLRGCYPPRPSTSVDKNLLYLLNSSYATQPHSLIAKYTMMNKPMQALEFHYPMIQFLIIWFMTCTQAVRVTKPKIPESIRRNYEAM